MKSSSHSAAVVAIEFPPTQGGIATLTYDYLKWMARAGEVHLFLLGENDGSGVDLSGNVVITHLPDGSARELAEKIKQSGVRLVLFNHLMTASIPLLWHLRCKGIRTYCLLHGMDMRSQPPMRLRLRQSRVWLRLKRWFLLRSFTCLIPNSRFTEKEARSKFPGLRTRVLNPGIWMEAEKEGKAEKDQTVPKTPSEHSVVSVGRLIHRKGVDTLLRALAQIPDLPATIIGDGPERREFEALSHELGLQDRVRFLGGISHAETLKEIRLHTIFCLLPREIPGGDVEGFGIVFLEAAAAGLPVIAGNSGGVPDAVDDGVNGFLVNPVDIEEIISKLDVLLNNNEKYLEMAKMSKSWAAKFDWNRRVRFDQYLT